MLPIQGIATVTLTSGDGSLAITFDKPLKNIPRILLTINDDDMGATEQYSAWAEVVTTLGFTIFVEGTIAAGTIDVAWTAIPVF